VGDRGLPNKDRECVPRAQLEESGTGGRVYAQCAGQRGSTITAGVPGYNSI